MKPKMKEAKLTTLDETPGYRMTPYIGYTPGQKIKTVLDRTHPQFNLYEEYHIANWGYPQNKYPPDTKPKKTTYKQLQLWQ